ncbi:MAG: hypothetical protein COA58_07945 [Bacteroidetes bacterium]|nr:MAG: hypothetical protein COA58_07945 [Bacteroidota bacterium]
MKLITLKILTLFLLGILSNTAFAGNEVPKEKVYSFIKQKQSAQWYIDQANVWGEYLEENSKDADGWLNFYTAKRMLKLYGANVSHEDLIELVKKIGTKIPNTFEYHYISYWNAGLKSNSENLEHLNKAQELGPNRVELMDDLLTYYEINRDKENIVKTCKRWFASNDISAGVYAWNYNMLQSTEENAILITFGDNDTYPSWVLQHAKGIRQDVTVINISLISIDSYRIKYLKELGIPQLPKKRHDYSGWKEFKIAFVEHLKTHTYRPLYFAISSDKEVYESFEDEVYNVGLAYKWSKTKFDNIAVTKRNFEKKYLMDYIKLELQNDLSQGVVDHANTNYLIPLLTLYNHYEESEDVRSVEVKQLIKSIAMKNDMEMQVAKLLNETNSGVSLVVDDPRKLETGFLKVNDTLYALETEVNNESYDLFLTDLLKQKRYDELNVAKAAAVNWRSLLSSSTSSLTEDELFKNGNPSDPLAPVVNLSYEGAIAYCNWLTTTYNSLEHKKKKFGLVEFKLPTEAEWEYIANGGKQNMTYSWGGPYVRNSKGCFLANLRVGDIDDVPGQGISSETECSASNIDGAIFTVRGDSYYPNGYGLYGITGNVSEMTNKKGLVKGGSWNTRPNNATITSKESHDQPSPEVGFRVIMVVK